MCGWMYGWMDVNNVCLGVITYVYCMHACMILHAPHEKKWSIYIYISSAWTFGKALAWCPSVFLSLITAQMLVIPPVKGPKGGQYFRKIEDQNVTFPNQKKDRFQVMKSQARNMEWKIWSQPWSNWRDNMEWNTFWFQRPPRSCGFKYQLNNTKLNIHAWSSWPVEDSNCNKRSHLTLQQLLLQKGVRQTPTTTPIG